MIGTGVFTSLGFAAAGIKSIPALLALWFVGGIIALCGAFTYAELGLRFPRAGGEYNFLSRIYHPALGFLSGWVSGTVAFAAPIALAAMAFGKYFYDIFPYYNPEVIAVAILLIVGIINLISLSAGTAFQRVFTITTLLLIVIFIAYGFSIHDSHHFEFQLNKDSLAPIFSSNFASSLVYVSFAYSGWNSVTYIIDEIDEPKKTLPRALTIATGIVLCLYVALNFIFLYTTPIFEMEGREDVAAIAAINIFGTDGAKVINAMICIALFASINSMLIAGPRVMRVIGEDFEFFKFLAKKTKGGTPLIGTLFMMSVALILILTSTFQIVITYIGFTLSLFTLLTVIGIFIVRAKNLGDYNLPNNNQNIDDTLISSSSIKKLSYTTWGYPLTSIIFIALEGWMVLFLLNKSPNESIAGLVTILLGLIVYVLIKKKN